MPRTDFDPAVHGFQFANRFVNVVARLPRGVMLQTNGRCGGMVWAALDYFHADRPAPPYRPVPPARVPPDGHPLADYLLSRQLQSFANQSALRFLTWTVFPDDGLPFARGVRKWTADEISELRAAIDGGRPQAVGLISARTLSNVGSNHQAVAFGYEVVTGGVDVLVYDPNTPRRTTVLRWRRTEPRIEASNRAGRPWRGLFVHDYTAIRPRSQAG